MSQLEEETSIYLWDGDEYACAAALLASLNGELQLTVKVKRLGEG